MPIVERPGRYRERDGRVRRAGRSAPARCRGRGRRRPRAGGDRRAARGRAPRRGLRDATTASPADIGRLGVTMLGTDAVLDGAVGIQDRWTLRGVGDNRVRHDVTATHSRRPALIPSPPSARRRPCPRTPASVPGALVMPGAVVNALATHRGRRDRQHRRVRRPRVRRRRVRPRRTGRRDRRRRHDRRSGAARHRRRRDPGPQRSATGARSAPARRSSPTSPTAPSSSATPARELSGDGERRGDAVGPRRVHGQPLPLAAGGGAARARARRRRDRGRSRVGGTGGPVPAPARPPSCCASPTSSDSTCPAIAARCSRWSRLSGPTSC